MEQVNPIKFTYQDVRDAFYKLKDIIENVTPYPSRAIVLGKLEELHDIFSVTLDEEARKHFTSGS